MKVNVIVDQILIELQRIKCGKIFFSLQIENSENQPVLSSYRTYDDIDFSGEILSVDFNNKQTDVFILYLMIEVNEFNNVIKNQKLAFLRFPISALPKKDYTKGHFTFSLMPNSLLKKQPKITLYLQISEQGVIPFKKANRGKINEHVYKIFNYGVDFKDKTHHHVKRRSTVTRTSEVKANDLAPNNEIYRNRSSARFPLFLPKIYQSVSSDSFYNSSSFDCKAENELKGAMQNINSLGFNANLYFNNISNEAKETTALVMKQVNKNFWNVLANEKFILACAEYLSKEKGFENLEDSIQSFLISSQNNDSDTSDIQNDHNWPFKYTPSMKSQAHIEFNDNKISPSKARKSHRLFGKFSYINKNQSKNFRNSFKINNEFNSNKKITFDQNMDLGFLQSAPPVNYNSDFFDSPPFLNNHKKLKSIDPPPFNFNLPPESIPPPFYSQSSDDETSQQLNINEPKNNF